MKNFDFLNRKFQIAILLLFALASPSFATKGQQITVSTVQLSTGIRMEYAERAPNHGHGRVVIMMHGFLDSWYSFSEVMALMPRKYHVFSITHRGHGGTDKPLSGYSMSDYADDLLAFIDHFGFNEVDLVGHSMGSLIAQRFAIDHPDRVGKIVLVGSAANVTENVALNSLTPIIPTLTDPVDLGFIREFVESIFFGPIREPFVTGLVNETAKVPVYVWDLGLQGLLETDTTDELHLIQAPTLILWGSGENLFLYHEQLPLIANIPNNTFLIYPNTGHAMQWEKPYRAAWDIAHFLNNHGGGHH